MLANCAGHLWNGTVIKSTKTQSWVRTRKQGTRNNGKCSKLIIKMHNKTRHLETMKLQGLKTQTNQGRDEKVRMIMMQTWVETRHESNIVTTIKMHNHMTQTTMKHKSSAIHAGSCDVHQELLREDWRQSLKCSALYFGLDPLSIVSHFG